MAVIGFTDQLKNVDREPDKPITEEERKTLDQMVEEARKSFYVSERREEWIRAHYDGSVVRDYDDGYHLSEQERNEQNQFYSMFSQLNRCKRKYRRLPDFIKCARISLGCLAEVAGKNHVYEQNKFVKLVMRGKIHVLGWFYPKYVGSDRKRINWDYIKEFIESNEDPAKLLPSSMDGSIFEEEHRDPEEVIKALYGDELGSEIISGHVSKERERLNDRLIAYDVDEDGRDGSDIVVALDREEEKQLRKAFPSLVYFAKDYRAELKSMNVLQSYTSDASFDSLESLSYYDKQLGIKSDSDIPEFKGDVFKGSDRRKYFRKLEEWEKNHLTINRNGRMITLQQLDEINLKSMLEENGWNIRAMYDNKDRMKRLQKARERDKKRERDLKNQLTRIQKRSKRRMGDMDIKKEKSSKKKKKKSG